MNKRIPILIVALLAASGLSGVFAKSYEFKLEQSTAVGNVQLPPGQYSLNVKDGTAILTNTNTGQSFKIPVKITNAEKKFKNTMVIRDTTATPKQLKFIELGGSTIRVEFPN